MYVLETSPASRAHARCTPFVSVRASSSDEDGSDDRHADAAAALGAHSTSYGEVEPSVKDAPAVKFLRQSAT
jgi:hypothetical protein